MILYRGLGSVNADLKLIHFWNKPLELDDLR
ncbi:hypothetical protein NNRS527_01399 [Nitrosospira sp. NRS527]|nr:hypothetical protein NNRS527_01399 [Nitrosospira sp. NRS527]